MPNIGILSYQNGIRKGMQDFYPLFKWKNELKREGIHFSFYTSHDSTKLLKSDVIFISHRYLRYKVYQAKEFKRENFIIPTLEKIKKFGKRIVLFDYMAGSGCRYFSLIDYVDVIVKRQLLKDKVQYLESPEEFIKPYIWSYNLNDDEKSHYKEIYSNYVSCPKKSLHKLEIGWNTGMVDHRYFPFSRYYPFSTEKLFNSIYKKPTFENVNKTRLNGAVFRGQIKDNKAFSYQRNKLIDILNEMDTKYNSFTGPKVSKREYIKELKNSKICVSPFGWGEICYRDFEAVIYGCILIKPNMDHLETWPDIFNGPDKYLAVNWDMSDAEECIIDTIENYEARKKTAINLQKYFSSQLENSDYIVRKIKKFCGL